MLNLNKYFNKYRKVETRLIYLLENSQLFDNKTKSEIKAGYNHISEKSKKYIEEVLLAERKMILNFLSQLKNEDEMNFVKVKEYIEKKKLEEIRKEERLEKENINNLLLELQMV